MTDLFPHLRQLLHEQIERHRHRGFLEAAMAACALVAAADGHASFRERSRIDGILESLEGLRVFDPHEGVDAFDRYLERLEIQPEAGRREAVEAVRRQIDEDPAQGPLLLRLCRVISEANGEPSSEKRRAIADLCAELGLEPGPRAVDA